MAAMTTYLDELDAVQPANPRPKTPVHRILAAYGPRMIELARDRSAGAHTYHVNVSHTGQAREILGPDAFLGVEHAVLFETDPDKARTTARSHLRGYLAPGSTYNLAKFRRLGYSAEDLSNGGSDRLVDDLVYWGGPDTIAGKLHAHLEAGADHVAVQVVGVEPGQTAMPYWRMLGNALLPGSTRGT
jgi:probable F420-dependent oxidoreductase